MDPLHRLGWSPSLAAAFEPLRLADPSLVPARVASDHRESLRVLLASGEERIAAPSGRLRHTAVRGGLPVAGDWVALEVPPGGGTAVVHAVLPRRTVLERREAGEGAVGAQILAAQVDTVFIAAPLDREVRPRLLERALALAWEGGADPVVLLTKSDLDSDPAGRTVAAEAACPGARVLAVSASTGTGVDALGEWLLPGRTVVLLGPSGAGKSTLANRLLGADLLEIGEVRDEDQRGRHTTVARRLVVLPSGALLLDTPGLREIGIFAGTDGIEAAFPEVAALAASCRFRDCGHDSEPGCAVRAAAGSGALDPARLESWRRLRREEAQLARKSGEEAPWEAKRRRRRWGAMVREALAKKPHWRRR